MRSLVDTTVDLVSPDRECHADGETDVVVPVGHRANHVSAVTDDSVVQSQIKVRIFLKAGQFLLLAISLNFPGNGSTFGTSLFG